MKREFRLPTILGVILAVSGLIAGMVLVGMEVRKSASASAEERPVDVRITNVSDNSFTVSWTTGVATSGFVKYGQAGETPDLVVSDERDLVAGNIGQYFTHYVTVRGLSPLTNYEFQIGSGRGTYDQDGSLYRVQTGAAIAQLPTADVAYGQVNTTSGDPADGAIVYVDLEGAAPLSALVKTSGSWVISLATARTQTLNAFVAYDKTTAKFAIQVFDGRGGVVRTEGTTGEDSPLGLITFGQDTAAATPIPTVAQGDVPVTNDEEATSSSKLSGEVDTLILLNPKFGEKAEGSPEVVGKAPANTEITIEIHSEHEILATVFSDASGNFAFDVPTDLEPGEHTITITAIINGVTQKITRSFVVLAAEDEFGTEFSASPSASPTTAIIPTTAQPSPTTPAGTTPTVTPRLSPTVRPTNTPTEMPTIMPETTDTELPVTGIEDWTWLIVGLGGIFVLGGMAVLAL